MSKIAIKSALALVSGTPFKSGNVEVVKTPLGAFELRLWGNTIAVRKPLTGEVGITTAGHPTQTTKRFLNALPGVRVQGSGKTLTLNGKPWDGEFATIVL